MPVSAVICGGIAAGNIGSTIAISGVTSRQPRLNFLCASVSVSTIPQVTSAPVPDVVGIQTSLHFAPRPKSVVKGFISSAGMSGLSYSTRIALAASMTEPPPTATTQSGSYWRIKAVPFFTVCSDGSGSTSSKTLLSIPA